MAAYVSLQNVIKSYHMGEITVHASDGITFDIEKGEFAVVVGPSGAGKTTVLNMLGGMDTCDEGKILVDGAEISSFSRKELTTYRRYDIGFVFQFYNLVQNLTALENVELAAQICREPLDAREVLAAVGLEERMDHRPAQMSGGQQQRTAIARAIAAHPPLILADEPTGNLDTRAGEEVLGILKALNAQGHTVILITHDPGIAASAGRMVRIQDGRILEDSLHAAG